MTIPVVTVTPSTAASAYGRVDSGTQSSAFEGFGSALSDAMQGVVNAGHAADAKSVQAISGTGSGNLTDVVTAVNKAELALQTTVAIRDRVVQAYQEIMRMPI